MSKRMLFLLRHLLLEPSESKKQSKSKKHTRTVPFCNKTKKSKNKYCPQFMHLFLPWKKFHTLKSNFVQNLDQSCFEFVFIFDIPLTHQKKKQTKWAILCEKTKWRNKQFVSRLASRIIFVEEQVLVPGIVVVGFPFVPVIWGCVVFFVFLHLFCLLLKKFGETKRTKQKRKKEQTKTKKTHKTKKTQTKKTQTNKTHNNINWTVSPFDNHFCLQIRKVSQIQFSFQHCKRFANIPFPRSRSRSYCVFWKSSNLFEKQFWLSVSAISPHATNTLNCSVATLSVSNTAGKADFIAHESTCFRLLRWHKILRHRSCAPSRVVAKLFELRVLTELLLELRLLRLSLNRISSESTGAFGVSNVFTSWPMKQRKRTRGFEKNKTNHKTIFLPKKKTIILKQNKSTDSQTVFQLQNLLHQIFTILAVCRNILQQLIEKVFFQSQRVSKLVTLSTSHVTICKSVWPVIQEFFTQGQIVSQLFTLILKKSKFCCHFILLFLFGFQTQFLQTQFLLKLWKFVSQKLVLLQKQTTTGKLWKFVREKNVKKEKTQNKILLGTTITLLHSNQIVFFVFCLLFVVCFFGLI